MNALLVPLTWVPALRRRLFADVKQKMIEPFEGVLRDAATSPRRP
jgi:hypothetical protein